MFVRNLLLLTTKTISQFVLSGYDTTPTRENKKVYFSSASWTRTRDPAITFLLKLLKGMDYIIILSDARRFGPVRHCRRGTTPFG